LRQIWKKFGISEAARAEIGTFESADKPMSLLQTSHHCSHLAITPLFISGAGIFIWRVLQEFWRERLVILLWHSALELNETAYLLGYEDANSFFRAFQNWEGTSPGQWRANHKVVIQG
jgi:AraC-like DNA-binding protein